MTGIHKVGRSRRDRRKCNGGFTLVELLMVITIIGILTGVSVTVVRQAYHTARVARTNATITKLDRVLMDMYADFENRRVPSPNFGSSEVASQVTQAARLWLLRDLIRMEMPCSYAEVKLYHSNPSVPTVELGPALFRFRIDGNNSNIVTARVDDSPLRRLYESTLRSCNGRYESAKCLYLVVMYGNPEVRELFQDREIATDPEDNLSYFVDGWGNPIYFLRWAPGLVLSERQPNILLPNEDQSHWSGLMPARRNELADKRPDPLDPTEIGGMINFAESVPANNIWLIDISTTVDDSNPVPRGWALLPVVMSSGGERDEPFNACFGMELSSKSGDAIVPTVDPFYWPLGAPDPNPKKRNHAVIHNHSARR